MESTKTNETIKLGTVENTVKIGANNHLDYYDNRRKDKRKHPITHGRYSPSSEEELEEDFFLESELEESLDFEEPSELELAFASLLEFLFKRASGPTA